MCRIGDCSDKRRSLCGCGSEGSGLRDTDRCELYGAGDVACSSPCDDMDGSTRGSVVLFECDDRGNDSIFVGATLWRSSLALGRALNSWCCALRSRTFSADRERSLAPANGLRLNRRSDRSSNTAVSRWLSSPEQGRKAVLPDNLGECGFNRSVSRYARGDLANCGLDALEE